MELNKQFFALFFFFSSIFISAAPSPILSIPDFHCHLSRHYRNSSHVSCSGLINSIYSYLTVVCKIYHQVPCRSLRQYNLREQNYNKYNAIQIFAPQQNESQITRWTAHSELLGQFHESDLGYKRTGFHDDVIGNHANTITSLSCIEITAIIRHAKHI